MKNRKYCLLSAAILLLWGTSACVFCFGSDVPYQSCGEVLCADPEQVRIAEILSEARVEAGLNCLRINHYLTESAQNHANYLTLNGGDLSRDESEDNPGFTGETWLKRIRGSGYPGGPASEFLAKGVPAERAAEMWLNSSDHYHYLLTSGMADIGIGQSGSIWVVDFGIP